MHKHEYGDLQAAVYLSLIIVFICMNRKSGKTYRVQVHAFIKVTMNELGNQIEEFSRYFLWGGERGGNRTEITLMSDIEPENLYPKNLLFIIIGTSGRSRNGSASPLKSVAVLHTNKANNFRILITVHRIRGETFCPHEATNCTGSIINKITYMAQDFLQTSQKGIHTVFMVSRDSDRIVTVSCKEIKQSFSGLQDYIV